MAAAVRLQTAARPVEGEIAAVIHPYQYHAIASDLASLSNGRWVNATGTPSVERSFGSSVTGLSEEIIRNYWVGNLAGTSIYTDPNIAIDGSDDAKGGVFAKRSIVGITYEEPSIRVQRDESMRGVEVNYVGAYGQGMYEPAWAFELYTDASTPTV
jgi:hypothetical protein